MEKEKAEHATFVIVGGGIAGVSCAEQLSLESPNENVLLISASPLIKAVTNLRAVTERMHSFDIEEQPSTTLEANCPNVRVVHAVVTKLDVANHVLYLNTGQVVKYTKLCLCAGAVPKVIAKNNDYVLGIRDTETVQVFQKKLKDARRIVVVGNGGIAIELVYEIQNCQVVWAVKNDSIGSTFFDGGAAVFFLPSLQKDKPLEKHLVKRTKYSSDTGSAEKYQGTVGGALGPDWSSDLPMDGKEKGSHLVHVEYKCEVASVLTHEEFLKKGLPATQLEGSEIKEEWPVYAELTNGAVFGCDFIVSATGVIPNVDPFLPGNQFKVAEDGGIIVDDQMWTGLPDVYAAGDICTAGWTPAKHWLQMRLWSQGRLMGAYAARCMIAHLSGEEIMQDISFDLFAHVTQFFGYKVVLLGLFNGQRLGGNYELRLRMTRGEEYVKVLVQNGRVQGAILIGETDLEETFENLILNQMDISNCDILNPNVDIEDYFD